MSWSLTVGKTPKADWDAAVDAATPAGQDGLPGVAEAVAAAKEALKAFGKQVKRPNVTGSANGHALQPEDGSGYSDSVSAQAYGTE